MWASVDATGVSATTPSLFSLKLFLVSSSPIGYDVWRLKVTAPYAMVL